MRRFLASGFLAALLFAGCDQLDKVGMDNKGTKPAVENPANADNTAVNKRDASGDVKTPINQDENQNDLNRTAEIRKRVLKQDGLSINARNVKIITSQNRVTLRGPVASEAEKETIDQIARDVAGDDMVDDQIEVKTGK